MAGAGEVEGQGCFSGEVSNRDNQAILNEITETTEHEPRQTLLPANQ
jgi:hypothetical protein